MILPLVIMALLSIPLPALAQAPPAPPPTCEVQLADAQQALLQLRKRAAQAEFQAASVEEIALGLQKRVQELTKPDEKQPEEKKPK